MPKSGAETRVMLDSGPLLEWIGEEGWWARSSESGDGMGEGRGAGKLSDAMRTALVRGLENGVMELGAIDRICVELGREEMVAVLYG